MNGKDSFKERSRGSLCRANPLDPEEYIDKISTMAIIIYKSKLTTHKVIVPVARGRVTGLCLSLTIAS